MLYQHTRDGNGPCGTETDMARRSAIAMGAGAAYADLEYMTRADVHEIGLEIMGISLCVPLAEIGVKGMARYAGMEIRDLVSVWSDPGSDKTCKIRLSKRGYVKLERFPGEFTPLQLIGCMIACCDLVNGGGLRNGEGFFSEVIREALPWYLAAAGKSFGDLPLLDFRDRGEIFPAEEPGGLNEGMLLKALTGTGRGLSWKKPAGRPGDLKKLPGGKHERDEK